MELTGHIVDIVKEIITDGKLVVEKGRVKEIIPLESIPEEAPYIMPGFVDSHLHIESTLLRPSEYARVAMRRGTLYAVCDPHEIVNVCGVEGIDYMIEEGRKSPMGWCFMCPSCVPSTPFETAGAVLDAKTVEGLLMREEIHGLAEMMNVPGVVFGDKEVHAKLKAARKANKPIDGHAPGAKGDTLNRYVEAGISTDHECTTIAEAEERIRLGMKILIREGSAACDFENLAPLLKNYPNEVMFCSDDKYADELKVGYIDDMVRRALRKDIPLWNILKATSLTPKYHYNLDLGLLQEGDHADFIVVDNLQDFNIIASYRNGNEVSHLDTTPVDSNLINNFEATPITTEKLSLTIKEGKPCKVICAKEGSLLTACELVQIVPKEGNFVADIEQDILKVVCMNRYQPYSKPAVALIHGFGLKRGAIGSTIAHDSHNIIAVGTTDEEIALAINTIIQHKGGLSVVDGKEVNCLPLPIAGLMSDRDADWVGLAHQDLKAKAKQLGCSFSAPFMTMAFMALPVIPELKLTDKGLFDGVKFEFTSIC